ncbi:MAG: N-acetylglucosamine-6-phosphate deacetylase [Spirochaetaceae bacterium]|nr:MAG: N-acetylglucosamine-6-phosphate deacetylase [Spirochaetaceae bacterium]
METMLITGGRIITPFEELEQREILLGDGKIRRISAQGTNRNYDRRIDATGMIVVPGFIDVHVQGAGGADVLDARPEALDTISLTCARYGVTGYLATTVYRTGGDNGHLRVATQERFRSGEGAELLGIHLEGPFIAAGKRGMIREDCLAPVENEILDRILELTGDGLRMMTIAPELPAALQLIRRLQTGGVVASFGHSEADYPQTLAGIEAGVGHVTHLYNAMMPMHHRDPGPIPALLESTGVSAQIIPDGVHIHPAMLRLAGLWLTGNRMVLITDGMQAMGLPDGRYLYNGLDYESKNGTARYLDGTLIGTALGMNELIARCLHHTDCSLAQVIQAASFNPACVLGLQDRKGSLDEGKDADLVLLESDLRVSMTIRAGRCVYEA